MNFIDKASVFVQAGNGGNGRVSFRREIYVDKGGPDGGDGGDGGDVIFVASNNQNTLANFRYQKTVKAKSGEPGGKRRKHGKSGEDLLVPVPVGTVISGEDGKILADLAADGQQVVIAHGGRGGFGNAHFTSSTRQTPRIAELGELGEAFTANLELKMIADVGLVGLPNAGKSTLLSVISGARPEIADYPFTTLTPNLGVVDIDKTHSLLFADIPGLIEGAAAGKGLGDEFLRHIERTAVLIHLIDVYQEDIAAAYQTIQKELKDYKKVNLAKKPQIVALNKTENLDPEILTEQTEALRKIVPSKTKIINISAAAKSGLPELLRLTLKMVEAECPKKIKKSDKSEELPVIKLPETGAAWQVQKTADGFIVTGAKIERFARRTDFNNEESVRRLRDIMRRMGIMHELQRQSIKEDDTITINGAGTFPY